MIDTPRTNKISHKGLSESSYIVAMTDLARELEQEIEEQCRLNGKGAQREAALVGEVERLKRQLEAANFTIEFLDKEIRMLEDDLKG